MEVTDRLTSVDSMEINVDIDYFKVFVIFEERIEDCVKV